MWAWGQVNLPTVNRVAALVNVPLVFGGIGYISRTGDCSHPAGNGSQGALPAPLAQLDAYRALFDVAAKSRVSTAWRCGVERRDHRGQHRLLAQDQAGQWLHRAALDDRRD